MVETEQTNGTILVVDDDASIRALATRWLEKGSYRVENAHDGESCLDALSRLLPDAVLLDLNMPGMGGMAALEHIQSRHRPVPVIILTSTQEIETVVQVMQLGAYDYLTKPIDRNKLLTTLHRAVEHFRMSMRIVQLEREVDGRGYAGIVGTASPMRELFRQMDRVAASDISVLIHGQSGTGKELVALAIHEHSGRKNGPFVALNCAAIPETLQESEMFGHERGSFTGATGTRIGKFEQAHEGTLFLDEVGELSLSAQAKLLRVLQEKRFNRVGGTREIEADFRLLAATHRNLWDEVQAGRFREDLYFRIVVFELEVPALKERIDDVLLLVQRFIDDFQERGRPRPQVGAEALEAMRSYDWPGNVRELQNAVQRALVVAGGDVIRVSDLPPHIRRTLAARREVGESLAERAHDNGDNGHAQAGSTPTTNLPLGTLAEIERLVIEDAMRRNDGNVTRVVRELGIGRTTLYRKLKDYNLR